MTLLEMLTSLEERDQNAEQAASELKTQLFKFVPRNVSPQLAEDIVQDVLLKVLTQLSKNAMDKKSEGSTGACLYRMVRNRFIDIWRKNKPLQTSLDDHSMDKWVADNSETRDTGPEKKMDRTSEGKAAKQALVQAYELALERREPRWRENLVGAWDSVWETLEHDETVEEQILRKKILPESASRKEFKAQIARIHKNHERLRTEIYNSIEQMRSTNPEHAQLAELACEFLLRKHSRQKKSAPNVDEAKGENKS